MDRQDYEPGPVGASYSRTGPPPMPEAAAPAAADRLKQEFARELTPHLRARLRRSVSRIKSQ